MARKKREPFNAFSIGDRVKLKPVELRKPLKNDGVISDPWTIKSYDKVLQDGGRIAVFKVVGIRPTLTKRNQEGVYHVEEINPVTGNNATQDIGAGIMEGKSVSRWQFQAHDGVLDPEVLDRSVWNTYEAELDDGITISFDAP